MSEIPGRKFETFQVYTRDKEIGGYVSTLLFDQTFYYIQFFVIDTTRWIPGNMRLISPEAVHSVHENEKKIFLDIPKNKIEKGPDIWKHLPVAAQERIQIAKHFGWPVQRLGNIIPIPGVTAPPQIPLKQQGQDPEEFLDNVDDFPLRSSEEIIGYQVYSPTDHLGTVDDFIVETEQWYLKYFVLKMNRLLKPGHLQISCQWITEIDWDQSRVLVDLSTELIRHADS